MAYHPVRNFLGLAILYSIIIFGIFALQFRNELSILQLFGSLQLRLSETSVQNSPQQTEPVLKNSFQVSSNGIVLFASESMPLMLQNAKGESIPLVLQDLTESSDESFILLFSENVSLNFLSSGDQFYIQASLPTETSLLTIPYKTTDSYTVTDLLHNRIVFESKEDILMLQADEITENTIILSQDSAIAHVAPYEKTTVFSFDSVIGYGNASAATLATLSSQMRSKIVTSYASAGSEALKENAVAAYVAELASQGRYNDGITTTPQAFINGTKRTYFTAPYFNTLVRMNQSLVMERETISFSMQHSVEKGTLDVFELDKFPFFLLQQRPSDIETILSLPASLVAFEPTVPQAIGILAAYTSLFTLQPASAAFLEPVLEGCIEVIEGACVLTETALYLFANDVVLDNVLTVKAGKVLLDCGKITSQMGLQAGGTFLITSVLENTAALNMSVMAAIYPYVAEDNTYYPHGNILAYENGNPVWAWNIAANIEYSRGANGTINIDTEFPLNETHYMIINGIEPFDAIEIRGGPYNTDPRFESYVNSPGYVYNAGTKTLLLQYHQKTPIERVSLFYNLENTNPVITESDNEVNTVPDLISPF